MVETGFNLPYWLSLPALILPFLTAILILFRNSFKEDSLTLLMLVCLVLTLKNLLIYLSKFDTPANQLYLSIFNCIEFSLLFLIFRGANSNKKIKEWANYFLVAVLSATITLYLFQPGLDYLSSLNLVFAGLLVLSSLFALFLLIRNQYIFIFHSPLFWIAGGTLFYYGMVMAIVWFNTNEELGFTDDQKTSLLGVFNIVRFILYLIASVVTQSGRQKEEWEFFKKSTRIN